MLDYFLSLRTRIVFRGRQEGLRKSGGRHRAADRLHLSGRKHAGISKPEGLRRIRRCGSAIGLERLADIRALACGANASYILKAEDHEIEASVPTHDLVTKCAAA